MASARFDRQDDARVAGRGFLLITAAKVYFMAAGAIISLGLPRLFGDRAMFGDFSVVNGGISILNMVMIAGTIQAVSKLVSEREGVTWAARRAGLIAQCGVGLPLAGLVFAFAGPIAGALRDPGLAPYIRVASLIVLFYSFYAVFVGVVNGEKRFRTQAALDISFSTLKAFAMLGLVILGFGVLGAFAGFAAAAFAVLLVAVVVARGSQYRQEIRVPVKRILWFMLPVMFYTLLVNLMLQGDRLLLKALKFEPLRDHFASTFGLFQAGLLVAPGGLGLPLEGAADEVIGVLAAHATSGLSGIYGAVKNIATLPYQGIIAITFVIFPLISRSTFEQDGARTAAYVRETFRYALILLALIVVGLLGASRELIELLFGASYLCGDTTLSLLLLAIVGFSMFYVGNIMLTGAGRPMLAASLGCVTVAVYVVLLVAAQQLSGPWRGALEATALSTLGAMTFGLLLVGLVLRHLFRAFVPLGTVLRLILLAAPLWWIARELPVQGIAGVLLKGGLASGGLALGLLLTGELSAEDRARLRRVLKRDTGRGES